MLINVPAFYTMICDGATSDRCAGDIQKDITDLNFRFFKGFMSLFVNIGNFIYEKLAPANVLASQECATRLLIDS